MRLFLCIKNNFNTVNVIFVVKYMLKKIWSYITFKKQENHGLEETKFLSMMHGINRITIFVFIIGIIIVIIKSIK